jgi:hypothetical protein
MEFLARTAPCAAKRLSDALGATTDACVGLAPRRLACVCRGAMAVELCHTLLVNGILAEHDGEIGVEVQPSRAATRIWTFIFAGLARVVTSCAPVSAEFAAHYRAVLRHTREWAFAYSARDADAACAALAAMEGSGAAMRALAREGAVRALADVLGVWVGFVLRVSRAAAGSDACDKSAAYVDEWLRSLAARSLSEHEMHAVCWVLDGVRPRVDEARFAEMLALFAPHGVDGAAFITHAAAACIAISELAG